MTQDEAIALFDSRFWEEMTPQARAEFQLYEDRLCMPFGVFHLAIEETLGRPVWTHEIALNRDGLKAELRGDRPPTMLEIINLIPADKRAVVTIGPTITKTHSGCFSR